MTSTFSPALRLNLQADGDNQNIWGEVANTVFLCLEQAITGITTVSITTGDVTLTAVQGGLDQSRAASLIITGVLTGSARVFVPPAAKGYWIWANYVLSGQGGQGGAVVVSTATGTGVAVPAGSRLFIMCDGTNCLAMTADPTVAAITSGSISGLTQPLPLGSGGTGASTAAGARSNFGLSDAATTPVSDIVALAVTQSTNSTISGAGGSFTGHVAFNTANPVLDGTGWNNGQATLSSSTSPRIGFSIPNVNAVAMYMATTGEMRLRYANNSDVPLGIPIGGILNWDGALSGLPSNYVVCDGTNGTSDLRDRFIVAAGASYAVRTTGGSTSATTGAATVAISATTDSQGAHSHFGAVGNTTLSIGQIPGHAHAQQGTFTSGGELATHIHTYAAANPTFAQVQGGSGSTVVTGVGATTTSTSTESIGHSHNTAISGNTDVQGGSGAHSHTITSDGAHAHNVTVTGGGSHSHTVAITPPFFALYYIKRTF